MRRRWAELVAAFALLTRLPIGRFAAIHPPSGACVWAYPLVGAVIGAAAAAVLRALTALGLSQPVAVVWALAVTILLTGGLHEDGLADTADGFGGGATRDRKLAIMRDSRIGSYGAVALILSLVLRAAALMFATRPELSLVLAAVFGRAAMLVPLLLLHPARTDGLAAPLADGGRLPALAGLALSLLPGVLYPEAWCAAGCAAFASTIAARRQIGGYTGDVLGATQQIAECATLSLT